MTASNCLGSPIGVIGAVSLFISIAHGLMCENNVPPRLIHHETPVQVSSVQTRYHPLIASHRPSLLSLRNERSQDGLYELAVLPYLPRDLHLLPRMEHCQRDYRNRHRHLRHHGRIAFRMVLVRPHLEVSQASRVQ